MKVFVSILILLAISMAMPSFAQDKKPQRQPTKSSHGQFQLPETLQIIYRFVRGAKMESQDAKNVSFTLKPNRAFITIEF